MPWDCFLGPSGSGWYKANYGGGPLGSTCHSYLPVWDTGQQRAGLGRTGRLDLWDWRGLQAGTNSGLCLPGGQGHRGRDRTGPGPPATQSSLPVVSGWSWQDASARVPGPDLSQGLLPPPPGSHMHTHTCTHMHTQAHGHTHINMSETDGEGRTFQVSLSVG